MTALEGEGGVDGPSEELARATVARMDLAQAREYAVRWARRHDQLWARLQRLSEGARTPPPTTDLDAALEDQAPADATLDERMLSWGRGLHELIRANAKDIRRLERDAEERRLRLEALEGKCGWCAGTGRIADSNGDPDECRECQGSGERAGGKS